MLSVPSGRSASEGPLARHRSAARCHEQLEETRAMKAELGNVLKSVVASSEPRGTFGHRAGSGSAVERRQFADSRSTMDPEVRELADAIDSYKLAHNRRYITLAEVLEIIKELGYHK
jgi:hypothetical protein